MLDQKIQYTLTEVAQLKENQLVLRFPYEVLHLIYHLEISTSLDTSYYVQYQIKKRNGSVRVLNEPKPNLKLIQTKLLDLIDYFAGNYNDKLSFNNKLIDGVVAYRKKKSVIQNANFHIGQEFVLKLDIKDFFNQVDTSKLHGFWVEILGKIPRIILKKDVFATDHNSYFLEEFIDKLATKLVYVTSLDFHLAQGSPTSGALANYYLTHFDNRLLNYCNKRKLNYSRYSDDITISGKLEDLQMGNLLGAMQHMLKERKLKLNKEKTKLLRANRKQMVTGIVVNVKKTAGREYKRTIRQEVYYLKKFREAHIAKKAQNTLKYIETLLGKISWAHSIEKEDAEFKRYKGELVIINRFVKSGKSINEAIEYLEKLAELTKQLISDEKVIIEGVEWKTEDEICSKETADLGVYSMNKRGKVVNYFDEFGLKNHLSTLEEGWRLPTIDEFKSYLKATHYDDRKLLGLHVPSDPNLNGIIQMNKSYSFNKIGGYWTSNMQHVRQTATEFSVGRTVFLSFSKNWDPAKKTNGKIDYFGKNAGFATLNLGKPVVKNEFKTYIEDLVLSENNSVFLQSFSLRLVRTSDVKQQVGVNTHFSAAFWNSIAKSKSASKLEGLQIETIPSEVIREWKSSALLLANNQLRAGLTEYPPVLKVDLRNNLLQEFDFEKIPNTTKHLLLAGNDAMKVTDVPLKKLATHLHELSLPSQYSKQIEINYSDIYSYAIKDSVWFEIDSDEKLVALSANTDEVKHLKITIQPGSQSIDTVTLFNRLQVFVNLVSLHIVIEPKEEELRSFLNTLKSKSTFTNEDLAYFENIKQSNPYTHFENQADLQFWLYGELDFVATDLINPKLKNLILDFSWFPGVNFKGDFNLELERYHLLHPGTLPSNLPATSSLVHKPNILVKVLGYKLLLEEEDMMTGKMINDPKLCYILPFNVVSMYFVFNDLFSLYPNNQRHLDNLVLVLTNWQKKEIPNGLICSLFSVSAKYNYLTNSFYSSYQATKSVFNFPLLSYSLNFDVYKLSVPVKTIYFKGEIKENHFMLRNFQLPFYPEKVSLCYVNSSYVTLYNQRFSSDEKISLSTDNFLVVQNIFPKLSEDFIRKNNYKVNDRPNVVQFKLLNRFYSEAKITKKLNKDAVIRLLNETDFNPLHLPKKYLKDKDVMLTVAQNNPFSIIYAHEGLRQQEDFILNTLKTSIRTLVFFNRYLLQSEKGKRIVDSIYAYLTSLFNPAQFNYIVNQLSKRTIVENDADFFFFKFDAKNSSDVNKQMKSFEDEMISWKTYHPNWFSMSNSLRNRLIELAIENNLFNKDGYFTNIEYAHSENCTHLDLSYSDLSSSNETINNIALLSSAQRATIKTLNISFTRFEEFDLLKDFPLCEELYIDGLINLRINGFRFNQKFPKLKRLYIRCIVYKTFEMDDIYENCLQLEMVDARKEDTIDQIRTYTCSDGREIIVKGDNEDYNIL